MSSFERTTPKLFRLAPESHRVLVNQGTLAKLLAIPTIIMLLRLTPLPGLAEASYLLTALYSLRGRRQAAVSFLIVCLLNTATHSFGPPPALAGILRHLVPATSLISVFVLNRGGNNTRCPNSSPLTAATVLCGLVALHSLLFSTIPILSTLKILIFAATFLTQLSVWGNMTNEERLLSQAQVKAILYGVVAASLPMIALSIGYYGRTTYFKGLLVHSQSLGVVLGVLSAHIWLVAISNKKLVARTWAFAALTTVMLYLTRARVGGLAFLAGLAAGALASLISSSAALQQTREHVKFSRIVAIVGLLLLAILLSGGSPLIGVLDYIDKYSYSQEGDVTAFEAAYKSRGGIISTLFRNISDHPLIGVGFGVPSQGFRSSAIITDPIFGIPYMAASEKGFLPLAIIEELGIPLGSLWLFFFAQLAFYAYKGGAIMLGTFVAALTTNAAEACFFSPGGIGGFVILIACMTVTAYRYKHVSNGANQSHPNYVIQQLA